MATNNILGYTLPDKKRTDTQFRMLFTKGASGVELSFFIREHYIGWAVFYAIRKLGITLENSNQVDSAIGIAVDVIESVIKVDMAGNINFKGGSAFSSYLFEAVSRTISSKRRIDYPEKIKRYGLPAMNAYRMHLLEGKNVSEVQDYLQKEHAIDNSDIPKVLRIINSFIFDEHQRQSRRPGGVVHISLDVLKEGRKDDERSGGYEPKSHYYGPEQVFERKSELEGVRAAVEKLSEPAKSVIKGYELKQRWTKISEMEKALGLKNGVYELKKAKEQLGVIMRSQSLLRK